MAKLKFIKCKCEHCGELNKFSVDELLEVERRFKVLPEPEPEPEPKMKTTVKQTIPAKKRRRRK